MIANYQRQAARRLQLVALHLTSAAFAAACFLLHGVALPTSSQVGMCHALLWQAATHLLHPCRPWLEGCCTAWLSSDHPMSRWLHILPAIPQPIYSILPDKHNAVTLTKTAATMQVCKYFQVLPLGHRTTASSHLCLNQVHQ